MNYIQLLAICTFLVFFTSCLDQEIDPTTQLTNEMIGEWVLVDATFDSDAAIEQEESTHKLIQEGTDFGSTWALDFDDNETYAIDGHLRFTVETYLDGVFQETKLIQLEDMGFDAISQKSSQDDNIWTIDQEGDLVIDGFEDSNVVLIDGQLIISSNQFFEVIIVDPTTVMDMEMDLVLTLEKR